MSCPKKYRADERSSLAQAPVKGEGWLVGADVDVLTDPLDRLPDLK
jgi:hypothetical protein